MHAGLTESSDSVKSTCTMIISLPLCSPTCWYPYTHQYLWIVPSFIGGYCDVYNYKIVTILCQLENIGLLLYSQDEASIRILRYYPIYHTNSISPLSRQTCRFSCFRPTVPKFTTMKSPFFSTTTPSPNFLCRTF